jgi:hypothetical protein
MADDEYARLMEKLTGSEREVLHQELERSRRFG